MCLQTRGPHSDCLLSITIGKLTFQSRMQERSLRCLRGTHTDRNQYDLYKT